MLQENIQHNHNTYNNTVLIIHNHNKSTNHITHNMKQHGYVRIMLVSWAARRSIMCIAWYVTNPQSVPSQWALTPYCEDWACPGLEAPETWRCQLPSKTMRGSQDCLFQQYHTARKVIVRWQDTCLQLGLTHNRRLLCDPDVCHVLAKVSA